MTSAARLHAITFTRTRIRDLAVVRLAVVHALLVGVVLLVVSSSATLAQTHDGAQGGQTPDPPARQTADPHAGHGTDPHAAHTSGQEEQSERAAPAAELPPFIPRLTDEDRRAAFPDVGSHHAAHDSTPHAFVLLDRLEWQAGRAGARGVDADLTGWYGGDLDRLWFRADARASGSRFETAQAHLLYGRRLFRWWDAVAGVRQDVGPGPSRTWAALGLQGLAPYWFEVEATVYVGAGGRILGRFEAEYDLRLTNRLIVQPMGRMELGSRADVERGVGAGLSTTEAGVRLRYLVRRELAPYIGVALNRSYGGTADFARTAGDPSAHTQLVAGVRAWF
ncbi:MAG: copper resistance protein B [Vicinamibacterales bacterium]